MKKLFLLIQLIFSACLGYAQTTGYIRNDTVKITNATKTATLVLETASKNHGWYLKDIGNGRTQFVQAEISDINHLQDSLIKKANDASTIHKTGNETKNGNLSILGTTGHAALTLTSTSGTGLTITNNAGVGLAIASPSGGNSLIINNAGGAALDVSGYVHIQGSTGDFDVTKPHLNLTDGTALALFGPSASGQTYIRQLGTNGLRITQGTTALTNGLLILNGTIKDEANNKYFLKQGDVPDSGSVIKKTAGVVHLATIAQLQAYTGTETTIIVTDSLRGGPFNYYPSITKNDGGISFTATGKGSGTWVRQCNMSYGINLQWYGAVPDYNPDTHMGTDNADLIQQAFDSQPRRGGLFFLPASKVEKRYYGISKPLRFGNATRLVGAVPSFPVQYNTTDTISYRSPSTLYAYAGNDAIMTDTTVNYRCQLPYIENLTILGTGRDGGATGINLRSNPANPTAPDVGLAVIKNVYVDQFTTAINGQKADTWYITECHLSGSRVAIRNGKQDLHVSKSCIFDVDTAYAGGGKYMNFIDNEIEPGTASIGIVLNELDGASNSGAFNLISDNQFKTVKNAIILKSGVQTTRISNNIFTVPSGVPIIIDSAGRNNVIEDNNFYWVPTYAITARQTEFLTIGNNNHSSPQGAATYQPYKIDTCNYLILKPDYDHSYPLLKKFNITGGSIEQSNVVNDPFIWSSDGLNSTPGIYTRVVGGSFASPALPSVNRSLIGLHPLGYNGSGINERATLEALTNENWSSTANGTRWEISLTQNGTSSRAKYGTFSRAAGSNALFDWNGDIKSTNLQLPLTGLLKGNGAGNNISAISGTPSQFVMGDGSVTNTSLLKYDGTALTTGVDILPATNGSVNLGSSLLNFNIVRAQQIVYSTGTLQLNASSSTGIIQLKTNSVTNMQMFPSGNIALQNGGTFSDAGNKLQVNGSSYFNGNIGIGTSTPNYNIEAYNANNDVRIQATRGAGFAHIEANSSGGALALTDLTGATTVQFRTYGDSFFNGGKFGIGTTAPTNTLTLGATTSGIAYYNTTDQITNYERMRQFWTNNVFNISTEMAGTGVGRNIKLSSGASSFLIGSTITGSSFEFRRDLTGFSTILNVTSTGLVGSSSQALILGDPTINQTGAGAYSIFWANPNESTLGSGFHYLFRGSIAGADKFTVDNAGKINSASLSASQLVGTDASKNLISLTVLPNGTTAATQTSTDNSTKVATTAFVKAQGYGTGTVTASSTDVLTNKDLTSGTNTFPTLNQNTTGNAATVTNGVYTTGSYANPAWISSLAYAKLTGAPANLSDFTNDTGYLTTISGITAGGDLTGTFPNPTINMINGVTKSYYDPTSSIQTQLDGKQGALTLTTTGTGAATLVGNTLNIPNSSTGSITSITPGYGFTSSTPITTNGTMTIDTTKVQTINNFFPKGDTRYGRLTAAQNWTAYNGFNGGIGIGTTSGLRAITFQGAIASTALYAGIPTGATTNRVYWLPYGSVAVDTLATQTYVNNAVSNTGTSGTYTPTITDIGLTGDLDDYSIPEKWHYIKVGNQVQVSGRIYVTSANTSGAGTLELSMPISSSLSSTDDIVGGAFYSSETFNNAKMPAFVSFSVNNKPSVSIQWSTDTIEGYIPVNFTYTITGL